MSQPSANNQNPRTASEPRNLVADVYAETTKPVTNADVGCMDGNAGYVNWIATLSTA